MHMRIDKAGCERMALTIDDASEIVFERLCSFIRPHINDSIPFDRYRLCPWICFVASENSRVRNNDIGRWHDSLLENVVTTSFVAFVKERLKSLLQGFYRIYIN